MKRSEGYRCVVFILLSIFFLSCGKRDYLKDAIQCGGVLCFRMFSEGYTDTIFVYNAPEYLKENLETEMGIKNTDKYIYKHIKDSVPIQVSKTYYLDQFSEALLIEEDSLMEAIYTQDGVAGLLKNYFKVMGSWYVFSNTKESFPMKGKKPFPAFGRNQNAGWMCYLLSQHNIYLVFDIIADGTLFTIIESCCSDMESVERYERESVSLPYRRNPYKD